jgi:hypothetical protein
MSALKSELQVELEDCANLLREILDQWPSQDEMARRIFDQIERIEEMLS